MFPGFKKFFLVFIFGSAVLIFLVCNSFIFAQTVSDLEEEIANLKNNVEKKNTEIDRLQAEAKVYEENIVKKRGEALNLNNELDIIENQIAKLGLDIQINEAQISQNQQETEQVGKEIKNLDFEITNKKVSLEKFINLINENDKTNWLMVLLSENDFGQFFSNVQNSKELNLDVKNTIDNLKELKDTAEKKKMILLQKKEELAVFKTQLQVNKDKLEEEQRLKNYYLEETKSSEDKFQQLLWQIKQEEFEIRNELASIEKKVQEKLAAMQAKKENEAVMFLSSDFTWPVPATRGLSTSFHDQEYPFRYIFEHPGVDIRAWQGTQIKASADGYVAQAKDNGYGYSYIMLVHNNGFSSVYGHVSKIYVKEDTFVRQGEVIGLSGGTPGTKGAGRLTTGPHLHFEIRLNGIPVNPGVYLP